MRARILLLLAMVLGACAPALAQPAVNASQLRLGVIGTVCSVRTGTAAPSVGDDCDVYIRDAGASSQVYVNVNGTWRSLGMVGVLASTDLTDTANLARLNAANVFTAMQRVNRAHSAGTAQYVDGVLTLGWGTGVATPAAGQFSIWYDTTAPAAGTVRFSSDTAEPLAFTNDSVKIGKTASTFDVGLALRASAVGAGLTLRESYAGNSMIGQWVQNNGDGTGSTLRLDDGTGTGVLLFSSDPAEATQRIFIANAATAAHAIRWSNTGGDAWIGQESSTGGSILTGSSAYALVLRATGTTRALQFGTNNTVRQTISDTGLFTFNGVALIGTDGKIPAISSTYFASLDGSTLTGISLAAGGTMDNNVFLKGKDTGATARNLIGYDTSDRVVVGNATHNVLMPVYAGSGNRCLYATSTGQINVDATACTTISAVGFTALFGYSADATTPDTDATWDVLYSDTVTGGQLANAGESIEFVYGGTMTGTVGTAITELRLSFCGTGLGGVQVTSDAVTQAWQYRGSVVRVDASNFRLTGSFVGRGSASSQFVQAFVSSNTACTLSSNQTISLDARTQVAGASITAKTGKVWWQAGT